MLLNNPNNHFDIFPFFRHLLVFGILLEPRLLIHDLAAKMVNFKINSKRYFFEISNTLPRVVCLDRNQLLILYQQIGRSF